MGNTMNCFERWGKRHPDGPLLLYAPGTSKGSNSTFASLSTTTSLGGAGGGGGRGGGEAFVSAIKGSAVAGSPQAKAAGGASPEGVPPASGLRPSRRRPTYAAKQDRRGGVGDSELSEFNEDISEETEGTGESQQELSAKDIRLKKLSEFRRHLTKVVKLKTAIFQMTVKVTISKDGTEVVWFSGKTKDAKIDSSKDKKKPVGQFPVSKITATKAKADNPKSVEVSVYNPTFESYYFSFKSREDRESWQQQLEYLRKFLSMA